MVFHNNHIVSPVAFTIHTDTEFMRFEYRGKVLLGELRSLIGIEDLGAAIALDGLTQAFDTEDAGELVRQMPAQKLAGSPVNHHLQIRKVKWSKNSGHIAKEAKNDMTDEVNDHNRHAEKTYFLCCRILRELPCEYICSLNRWASYRLSPKTYRLSFPNL